MAENSSLSFLPWLRSGLGANSILKDDSARRETTIFAKLQGENESNLLAHEQTITLTGPGDVLGFTTDVIIRTEPTNGDNDFEPNYFPFIIFKDADFPWRYSPENNNHGKLMPWIALIVLKKDEISSHDRKNGIISIKKNGKLPLPDLSQLWAWAHVQIAGDVPVNGHIEYIKSNPELCCSRLMCPRELEPETLYSAFVVPAYESGREAGLKQSQIEHSLEPAWKQEKDSVELPVYYHWEFQTSEQGDFEELLSRLDNGTAPISEDGYSMGTRPVDGSKPDYFLDENGKEKIFEEEPIPLEGALVPPGFMKGADRKPVSDEAEFSRNIKEVLDESLQQATIGPQEDEEDPLVFIPVYGRYYQDTSKLELPDKKGKWKHANSWVHELNLDRRLRIAASFGTTVVQYNQEEYMQKCWEQAGAIKEANENLRLAATGNIISKSLKERHIVPLDDTRFTLITQPFHHYYVNKKDKDQRSFKAGFKASGLPQGSVSATFKRIAGQKIRVENLKLYTPWELARKNGSWWRILLRILLFIFRIFIQGIIFIVKQPEKLTRFLPGLKAYIDREKDNPDKGVRVFITLARIAVVLILNPYRLQKILLPALYFLFYLFRVPAPNEKPRRPDRDTKLGDGLKNDLGIKEELQDIYPLKSEIVKVKPIDINSSLRPCINMTDDLLGRLNNTIKVPWIKELKNFEPVMKAPKIDISLYKHLSEHSTERLVPGLRFLDNNTVLIMEENRKFIEGYLAGINHEMGRELVWREFPTDRRGTIFNYFWDPSTIENAPRDIRDIHEWMGEIGTHKGDETSGGDNRLVLVIKADLIRRYPNTIIFAVKKKTGKDWKEVFLKLDNDDSSGEDGIMRLENGHLKAKDDSYFVYKSVFSANVGVDVLFLGFPFSIADIEKDKQSDYEYFFIVMEHPSLPRFGLDVEGDNGVDPISDWDDLSWGHMNIDPASGWIDAETIEPTYENGEGPSNWNTDAAGKAWITWQKPVRIVMSSESLLATN